MANDTTIVQDATRGGRRQSVLAIVILLIGIILIGLAVLGEGDVVRGAEKAGDEIQKIIDNLGAQRASSQSNEPDTGAADENQTGAGGVAQTQSDDGSNDMWSNWRAAGYDGDCFYDGYTTGEMQELIRVPVVRDANRKCGWSWNGVEVTVSLPDSNWLFFIPDTGQYALGGQHRGRNFEVHYVPGYGPSTTAEDVIEESRSRELSPTCNYTEAQINELIDARSLVSNSADYQPVSVEDKDEPGAFGARGIRNLLIARSGMVITVHPFGDPNTSNADGEDDRVYMWVGDDATGHDTFASTLRIPSCYPEEDPIHDVCELLSKERANSLLEEPPFWVEAGNTGCEADWTAIRGYMRDSRDGSEDEIEQRLNEALEGRGQSNTDDSFRG